MYGDASPIPFIITLATLSIARGLALELAGGAAIPGMPDIILFLGGGSIGGVPCIGSGCLRGSACAGWDGAMAGVGPVDLFGRREP